MVGAVGGDSEQDLVPVVAQLCADAGVVSGHESTDVTQVVERGAVEQDDELVERRVENHVRQRRVPVAQRRPVADRRRQAHGRVGNAGL